MSKEKYGKFEFSFFLLYFKYWVVWFSFGLFVLLVNVLFYFVLFKIGCKFGVLGMCFGKKWVFIVQCNLEFVFLQKNIDEINYIVSENFKNIGMVLIEIGIIWFWLIWCFV